MAEEKKGAPVTRIKQRLSQYRQLLREIRDDRARLSALAGRSCEGKDSNRPDLFFGEAGDLSAYEGKIAHNVERCINLATAMQAYINQIEDSETRMVFVFRYVFGHSWQKVAYAMGWYDESRPRKKHDRYLATHPCVPAQLHEAADELTEGDLSLRRQTILPATRGRGQ